MRRIFTLTIFILFTTFSFGQIFEPEGLNMPGTWDGWTQPPTVSALAGTQGGGDLLPNTDLATRMYRTIINVQASGGDIIGGTYNWLFTSGPTTNYYANKWANITVTLNSIQTYTYQGGTDNEITVTNGNYYTVNWYDQGYQNTKAIFMETSTEPVTIDLVEDNYDVVGNGNDVTVTITLSGTPSAEENVFVRYTTDDFATWAFAQASGATNVLTATIPGGSVTGTADNKYYVFSTTLASGDLSTTDGTDVDLATLEYNTNGGSNYPLPVELTTFSASVSGSSVTLNWETATEVDNYGFEVERLQNYKIEKLQNWEKVGFVQGSGNSNAPKSYSFVDDDVEETGTYSYRLKQVDNDGSYEYSKTIEVSFAVPMEYSLQQNYPNPFNPATTIKFTIPEAGMVKLSVYNILGEEVAELLNGMKEAGVYNINFDAASLNSGIYFYKLQTEDFVKTMKMLLMK